MEKTYIENHFLINPFWKTYFLSKFPKWTVEKYIKNAWSLFESNGYRYEINRYSDNPDSNLYNAVKYIDLFSDDTDKSFIVGRGDVTYDSAVEQLLIMVICDYHVDFKTFK